MSRIRIFRGFRVFRGAGIIRESGIFRGSGIIQALSLMLFLLMLSSCEHKEFRYVTSSFRSLRVEFNWERYEDFQKPEGMRVIFFPKDGTSEPWIFDFPNGEGRQIELPENEYRVICYNYDTSGINWENPNSFMEYLAKTRSVLAPDSAKAYTTPSWLCGDHIDWVSLENIPEGTEKVITLYPVRMVSRYTYEVKGILNLIRVTDIRASLSGMSGSLLMAEDKLPDGISENLFFGGEIVGNQIKGGFYTFGYSQGIASPQVFKLYLKSKDGVIYVLEQDVSAQVHSVPVRGHLGDVHLIIDFNIDIPEIKNDGGSGGGGIGGGGSGGNNSSGGAGFDVGVDDWADVNEDIIC